MKVALCCIGRLENRYIKEYVEYYKNIGIDKIFLYDNNYDGEEHFENVIGNYVDEGFVEITDYRNKSVCQLAAYQDCYYRHGFEYDWICFFDIDEYLTFKKDNLKIKDYLSSNIFDNYDAIHVNWMIYDDNDLVYYQNKPLIERFIRPVDFNKCITYGFPENNHIKSIIRGGIANFKWRWNPHTPNIGLKCCNNVGKQCDDSAFNEYNFEKAYIKHFVMKTIQEYVNLKLKRGTPDINKKDFDERNNVNKFFLLNKKTKEKLDFIKNINKLDIFIGAHKTFEPKVSNDCYKIVVGNHKIENNSNLELIECGNKDDILDDRFYSEIYMLRWVAKNYPLKEYVGFCHNRKYFSFMDNVPNVEEILKENDVILGKPIKRENVNMREFYKICHNIDDLNIIENIIDEKFKDYKVGMNSFLYGKMMFPYNMFIMKREDFLEYINFIGSVLDEYVKIVGTDIVKRIEDNKEKYLKNFYPNNTIEYQYRIGGYLAERLTTVFALTKFKKIMTCDIIITEQKYNKNE